MNKPPEQDLQDVKRHVRQHMIIAIGIVIGTLTTLWTSQTNFGSFSINVAMTLAVAVTQASLVAGFFMHLFSEKKMIYCFLVFTAVFFTVMMGITFWARLPSNVVHYGP